MYINELQCLLFEPGVYLVYFFALPRLDSLQRVSIHLFKSPRGSWIYMLSWLPNAFYNKNRQARPFFRGFCCDEASDVAPVFLSKKTTAMDVDILGVKNQLGVSMGSVTPPRKGKAEDKTVVIEEWIDFLGVEVTTCPRWRIVLPLHKIFGLNMEACKNYWQKIVEDANHHDEMPDELQ